jgi:xanthine dehydrogenase accessory factor
MSERVLRRLAERLADGPVVLASVVATRGATPRKRGARMLVGADFCESTLAGGLAEARVIDAARALIIDGGRNTTILDIALDGGRDAAGICGGHMRIALRRWQGNDDLARARWLAARLGDGHAVELGPDGSGDEAPSQIPADPRLLIIGAGHCGRAVFDLARHLDVEPWIHDSRPECFVDTEGWRGARVLAGPVLLLAGALDTPRDVHALLLTRDWQSDLDALAVLADRPPAYIGMMGSRRRVRTVLDALAPAQRARLAHIDAPLGIEIGAETPHEIAISVLAGWVAWRAKGDAGVAAG